MTKTVHRWCVYSGFGCIVLFLLGFWVIAGFVPPPSPADTAQETAETFRDDKNAIRLGMVVAVFASALMGPWVAAISVHLKRIEGKHTPLTFLQLGFGTLLVFEFLYLLMFWQVATFRTERSDEAIQTLNDMAWIPFTGLTTTGVIQGLVIAAAILGDKRDKPVFPRWAGYFNIWVAFAFAGGTFNVFFKDGPLAWNGVIAWWIPLTAFGSWLVVMSVLMLRQETQVATEIADESAEPTNRELAAELAELKRRLDLAPTK